MTDLTETKTTTADIKGLWQSGLKTNNPAMHQLLGLCPLLAVSNNVVNSLALGLATLFVLAASNTLLSSMRHWTAKHLRIPLFVAVIATLVTLVQQVMAAYSFELYQSLGLFLALVTTNCLIMARVEAYAYRQPVLLALNDGLAQGIGFLIVLVLIGAIRELIGHGTLFSGMDRLLPGVDVTLTLLPESKQLLLAVLPPGAFFTLAFLIALNNILSKK